MWNIIKSIDFCAFTKVNVIEYLHFILDQFPKCGNRGIFAVLAVFFEDWKCSNQQNDAGFDAGCNVKHASAIAHRSNHWEFAEKWCGFSIRFEWATVWTSAAYFVPNMLCQLNIQLWWYFHVNLCHVIILTGFLGVVSIVQKRVHGAC